VHDQILPASDEDIPYPMKSASCDGTAHNGAMGALGPWLTTDASLWTRDKRLAAADLRISYRTAG
jgi:hypothetical protein